MTDSPSPINLNVTDISDAVKVIDHAAEQGAYRGWTNIRQILALRDRLDAFVVAAAAVTESTEAMPEAMPEAVEQFEPETPVKSYPRRQKAGR